MNPTADPCGALSSDPLRLTLAPVPPKPCVLVVEDDPALRNLFTRALADLATVHCAATGRAALEWLANAPGCDLVLCDLNLGDLTAFELLSGLESCDPSWCQRFLICTGGAVHGSQRARLQATKIPVLRKPFGIAALQHRVARLLAGPSNGLGAANYHPLGPEEQLDRRACG